MRSVLRRVVAQRVSVGTMMGRSSLTSSRAFAATTGGEPRNPVNVEEFTLDAEIVARHQQIAERWQEVGTELQACHATKDYQGIIRLVAKGLAILEEVGPMDSPVQCYSNLMMEDAQAHYNIGTVASASKAIELGKAALDSLTATATPSDGAKIAEIQEFIGNAYNLQGTVRKQRDGKDFKEAEETFRKVLHWMDVDAKKAPPMVAVAAVNQRRTVLLGLGLSLTYQAVSLEETGGDGKELFGKGLDLLLDALQLNIEANDVPSVTANLKSAIRCFLGVKDVPQAVATTEKYVSWCRRHNDEAGLHDALLEMESICREHKLDNPLAEKKPVAEASQAPTKPSEPHIAP